MRDINDKKLDSLLTEYYGAEPSETFTYCPREKKLAPIPFWHSSRRIAAAASLVLVSVLGIALFFLFGNKSDHSPLAVRPSPTVISAPSEDGGEDDGAPHDGTVTPASETVHSDPSQSASESSAPTGAASDSGRNSATVSPSVHPSQLPTSPLPTGSVKPTSAPQSISPTDRPTSPTDVPAQPTAPPTEAPFEPTLPQEPTDDHDDPDPPTEGGGEEPGYEPPTEGSPYLWLTVTDSFSAEKLAAEGTVYCRLFNNMGRALGDSDRFSDEHIARVVIRNQTSVYVAYDVPDYLITYAGYYNYIFYDESGKLLSQGQIYVD